ncbi:MAG: hypothetical protein KDK55_00030 [Chlamydiia bacterium]|nr:hypothetical protein [Chlamydiia bacterium]
MFSFHYFTYICFRILGFPLSLLPYWAIHLLGKEIGRLAYYVHRPFRKKAMTNLSIAKTLYLSEKQKKKVTKESFQTLAITCLEFFRLKRSQNKMDRLVQWGTPRHEVLDLVEKGQGVVFINGHQANWEVAFSLMTQRYPGTAIGKPIKNKWLYRWILSIREMHKGKIVAPKQALTKGYEVLKRGEFFGIVSDQALPESPYCYPLFGTRAWTTTAPALLAYRTGSPLVTVMTRRVGSHYHIWGSPLLWPDLSKTAKEEVPRLMDAAMGYLEESIKACPGQWLWQHDRWKQSGINHIQRKYRYSFILIIFPQDCKSYFGLLSVFRQLYPRSFISLYLPQRAADETLPDWIEPHYYATEKECFKRDWRYQIVFDFMNNKKLRRHFLKLGAFQALAFSHGDLESILKKTVCKPECLTKDFTRTLA